MDSQVKAARRAAKAKQTAALKANRDAFMKALKADATKERRAARKAQTAALKANRDAFMKTFRAEQAAARREAKKAASAARRAAEREVSKAERKVARAEKKAAKAEKKAAKAAKVASPAKPRRGSRVRQQTQMYGFRQIGKGQGQGQQGEQNHNCRARGRRSMECEPLTQNSLLTMDDLFVNKASANGVPLVRWIESLLQMCGFGPMTTRLAEDLLDLKKSEWMAQLVREQGRQGNQFPENYPSNAAQFVSLALREGKNNIKHGLYYSVQRLLLQCPETAAAVLVPRL